MFSCVPYLIKVLNGHLKECAVLGMTTTQVLPRGVPQTPRGEDIVKEAVSGGQWEGMSECTGVEESGLTWW